MKMPPFWSLNSQTVGKADRGDTDRSGGALSVSDPCKERLSRGRREHRARSSSLRRPQRSCDALRPRGRRERVHSGWIELLSRLSKPGVCVCVCLCISLADFEWVAADFSGQSDSGVWVGAWGEEDPM